MGVYMEKKICRMCGREIGKGEFCSFRCGYDFLNSTKKERRNND